MKHGFMVAAEHEACRVPEDLASRTPVEGYMVSFTAFYERGLGMWPHQFLHSILWYYGLKLLLLTPSGVLHIATSVTLCEAYLGIDSKLDLWKCFFRVRHLQDLEAELTISRGAVINV
jgi:hypothetical protein